MFKLVRITDVVLIRPSDFSASRLLALEESINHKYSDRILPGHGLCIRFFDFVTIGEDRLIPGDGCSHTTTTFRLVVFCPYIGETCHGKISEATTQGVRINMGFFDDVWVGVKEMPKGSYFDKESQSWFWEVDGAEFFLDEGLRVCFEVVGIRWRRKDTQPKVVEDMETVKKEVPFMIVEGTLDKEGLGDFDWWRD